MFCYLFVAVVVVVVFVAVAKPNHLSAFGDILENCLYRVISWDTQQDHSQTKYLKCFLLCSHTILWRCKVVMIRISQALKAVEALPF